MPTSPDRMVGSLSPPRGFSSPLRGSQTLFKSQGPTAKLEHVAERFAAFYHDLEQEKQQRRTVETTKFHMLTETISKLEKSLEAEIKRRAEADKQLQTHFETELKLLQDRTTSQIGELQTVVKSSIDGLSGRIQSLQAVVQEDRAQHASDFQHLAESLVCKVNECVSALGEERDSREQGEVKAQKQNSSEFLKLQDRLEAERINREAELSQLRAEIHDVLGNRNMSDEKFQVVVMEELAGLKSALALEKEERVAEDDEIVQAVNDYTRALQDGLRLVNNN